MDVVTAANRWVGHARPIIKAYLVLDADATWPLAEGAVYALRERLFNGPRTQAERDYAEATGAINEAAATLYRMIEDIRENAICDQLAPYPDDDGPEWDEADAINDTIRRETVSVEGAIKGERR